MSLPNHNHCQYHRHHYYHLVFVTVSVVIVIIIIIIIHLFILHILLRNKMKWKSYFLTWLFSPDVRILLHILPFFCIRYKTVPGLFTLVPSVPTFFPYDLKRNAVEVFSATTKNTPRDSARSQNEL